MRKTLIAIAAYFALVVPAHAQWAVIDSSNLVQNLRNAISTIRQEVVQAEELFQTYQQVMMQVKQLEQLPGEVVGELKGGLFDGLSQTLGIQKEYISQVKGLYGDVTNAKSMVEGIYQKVAASGLSPEQWYTNQAQWNQSQKTGIGFLTDYQAKTLDQVSQRYQSIQKLQDQIPNTEGEHAAMQLMNGQMNALLGTMNQMIEYNAVVGQQASAKAMADVGEIQASQDADKQYRDAVNRAYQNDLANIKRIGK